MKNYFNSIFFWLGLIGTVLGVISQAKELLSEDWKINLIIIATGLYFAFLGILVTKKNNIRTAATSFQSEEQSKASNEKVISIKRKITVLTTAYIVFISILLIWSKTCLCRGRSELGVVICRFEEKNNRLRDHISDGIIAGLSDAQATIVVDPVGNYFTQIQNKNEVLKEFDSRCFSYGLIVCGDYSKSERTFRCGIYLVKLPRLTNDTLTFSSGQKPIVISNPSNVELVTSEDITVDFVLGLLMSNSGDFLHCRSYMLKVIGNLGDVKVGDKKAKSLCYNTIATAYFKEKDTASARKFFEKSIQLDSDNTTAKDNLVAFNEYCQTVQPSKESTQTQPPLEQPEEPSNEFPHRFSLDSADLKMNLFGDDYQYVITKNDIVLKTKGTFCKIVGELIENSLGSNYVITENGKERKVYFQKDNIITDKNGKKIGSYKMLTKSGK